MYFGNFVTLLIGLFYRKFDELGNLRLSHPAYLKLLQRTLFIFTRLLKWPLKSVFVFLSFIRGVVRNIFSQSRATFSTPLIFYYEDLPCSGDVLYKILISFPNYTFYSDVYRSFYEKCDYFCNWQISREILILSRNFMYDRFENTKLYLYTTLNSDL